tara:strand:+ start:436 stop:1119 length:684 start_codon:yes stop_codon:yes gene_type:complete
MFKIPNKKDMYLFETSFHLTADTERYAKLLTHYELYKKIKNVPGDIVECGVYKGTSITRFASFRRMFETDSARKVIGFDNFNNIYPDTAFEEDQEQREKWLEEAGPDSITVKQLSHVFDSLSFKNYEFVEGDITLSLPKYIDQNPHLRIALLNIDIDFVEPTYCSLNLLYDRVCDGGVILLDNYGAFHGDTKGVDDFFNERNLELKINKFPFASRPVYLIKKGGFHE